MIVPAGASFATFAVTTTQVSAPKLVIITATYNGASVSGEARLFPAVTIIGARYLTLSQKVIITATTSVPNNVLSYSVDNGPSLGTMAFSGFLWTGKATMRTAPATAIVSSSTGGITTLPVTLVNQ